MWDCGGGVLHARWRRCLGAAVALRVLLIVWGEWQDAHWRLRYTDVDYNVFSDAAEHMSARAMMTSSGEGVREAASPYERATYRYSPLMPAALLVLLHHWLLGGIAAPWGGKLLFSLADVAVGELTRRLCLLTLSSDGAEDSDHVAKEVRLRRQERGKGKDKEWKAASCGALWLFNPLAINICTRGSADALVICLLLGAVLGLLPSIQALNGKTRRRSGGSKQSHGLWVAALLYGVSVHVRLYPLLYASAILVAIWRRPRRSPRKPGGEWWRERLRLTLAFGGTSALTAGLLSVLCYALYGEPYLREAVLYHVGRTDNRHNFSVHFLWIYLGFGTLRTQWLGLLAFVPQVVLWLYFAWRFAHKHLLGCMFLQTAVLVAFNKVYTGQYFVWYLGLLPASLPALHAPPGWQTIGLAMLWISTLCVWLHRAYAFEMLGQNTLLQIWIASIAFFWANVLLILVAARALARGTAATSAKMAVARAPVNSANIGDHTFASPLDSRTRSPRHRRSPPPPWQVGEAEDDDEEEDEERYDKSDSGIPRTPPPQSPPESPLVPPPLTVQSPLPELRNLKRTFSSTSRSGSGSDV